MLIEQVVVVYNAVNKFAGSDQKIEYTAGSFYIPVIDFVTSSETFRWRFYLAIFSETSQPGKLKNIHIA